MLQSGDTRHPSWLRTALRQTDRMEAPHVTSVLEDLDSDMMHQNYLSEAAFLIFVYSLKFISILFSSFYGDMTQRFLSVIRKIVLFFLVMKTWQVFDKFFFIILNKLSSVSVYAGTSFFLQMHVTFT